MIAKNCGGSIGYSDSFREDGKLSIYYRQAVLAAAYASSSGRGILPLSSCQRTAFAAGSRTGGFPGSFLHPAVRALEEYDSANHTGISENPLYLSEE